MKKDSLEAVLYGLAIGDSLGAATEFCTRDQIRNHFDGVLKEYTESISFITKDIEPGNVTDDFSSSYYLMKAILDNGGEFNREVSIQALLDWAKDSYYFENFSGANTKQAVKTLIEKGKPIIDSSRNHLGRNSNGTAMKCMPIAILYHDDEQRLLQGILDLAYPTHYNSSAVSGSCAVGFAIAESVNINATTDSILKRAIVGAKLGYEWLVSEGQVAVAPSIEKRLEKAISLMKNVEDFDTALDILYYEIGTGISVTESVVAALSILSFTSDTMEAIYLGVNAGGDTDTVAGIVGSILGGLNGMDSIRSDLVDELKVVNSSLEIEMVISEFINMVYEKESK